MDDEIIGEMTHVIIGNNYVIMADVIIGNNDQCNDR